MCTKSRLCQVFCAAAFRQGSDLCSLQAFPSCGLPSKVYKDCQGRQNHGNSQACQGRRHHYHSSRAVWCELHIQIHIHIHIHFFDPAIVSEAFLATSYCHMQIKFGIYFLFALAWNASCWSGARHSVLLHANILRTEVFRLCAILPAKKRISCHTNEYQDVLRSGNADA